MTFLLVLFCASIIIGVAYLLRNFIFWISLLLFGVTLLGIPIMFINLNLGLSICLYGVVVLVVTWVLISISAFIVAIVAVPLGIIAAVFKSIF